MIVSIDNREFDEALVRRLVDLALAKVDPGSPKANRFAGGEEHYRAELESAGFLIRISNTGLLESTVARSMWRDTCQERRTQYGLPGGPSESTWAAASHGDLLPRGYGHEIT